MLVTEKTMEARMREVSRAHDELRDRFLELKCAHTRLLEHLGLFEVTLPEKMVLLAKDGPEPGEL
jgi:hypothetical protein